MGLKLGGTNIDDVKLGASQVDKIYQGADLVWPTSQPIEFVGSNGLDANWTNGGANNWTYGNLGQQEGDIAVYMITTAVGQNGRTPNVTGYTTLWRPTMNSTISGIYIGWKRLGAGETSLTFNASGAAWTNCTMSIAIFRNVADVVPANDFAKASSGSNINPNPPAVPTALNAGSDWVFITGALNNIGAALNAPANYTRIRKQDNGNTFIGSCHAIGYRTDPAANENPGAWQGSRPNAPNAVIGSTLVLRQA